MPVRWLLLHYKLAPQPTARRVYVWRKLQRLGAIFWQDAAWVLPDNGATREQYQWLAAEIVDMGGQATLWEATIALPGSDEDLMRQFAQQADAAYQGILDALKKRKPNLASLSRQFQLAQAADYFQSALGRQVREALLAAAGGVDP
jgi:hypothetical protein